MRHGIGSRIYRRAFSEIGISVIGAVFHNAGQLLAAYVVIIRHEGVMLLLPLLLVTSVITGCLNGLAARFFIERFTKLTGETQRA